MNWVLIRRPGSDVLYQRLLWLPLQTVCPIESQIEVEVSFLESIPLVIQHDGSPDLFRGQRCEHESEEALRRNPSASTSGSYSAYVKKVPYKICLLNADAFSYHG